MQKIMYPYKLSQSCLVSIAFAIACFMCPYPSGGDYADSTGSCFSEDC